MNNDAFKHTTGDLLNETWTKLLVDIKIFDDMENHPMYLRNRFVLGASEWLAGNYGSKRNDKNILDYTDDEWAYIWSTMLEDRAWAVPPIKDNFGNIIKQNFAPEMMIKFIAHDLKCHIVVFDLLLDRIQFVSGNHLKSNNVVFDSPLLMYTTGSHFQCVMQQDHEYFIEYAKELESNNDDRSPQSQRSNISMCSNSPKAMAQDSEPKPNKDYPADNVKDATREENYKIEDLSKN